MRVVRSVLLLVVMLGSAAVGACGVEGSIQQVKEQHTAELMALPGVVSVGIGQSGNGEKVILVGMESADAAAQSAVPERIGGYPVEIRVAGRPAAQ